MKKAPHGSKNNRPGASPLKSKPFCDCRMCACHDCPDILNLLGIKVTEKSCDFGSKVAKGKGGTGKKKKAEDEDQISLSPSLLEIMNQDRDCTCEIMARTVRSHVHMNLGLTHRRDALINTPDSSPSTPRDPSTPRPPK